MVDRLKLLMCGAAVAASSMMWAQQSVGSTMPKIVEKDGRWALMVDGAPYLILGAQVNNSSAWPEEMPKVWPTVEKMGVNTLEVPIYWEQFESAKGQYDPSTVKTLLAQAREHHVHLVLLWFGLYKNGSGHYAPQWIKLDEAHVPHVVNSQGGKVDSLAPYSDVALNADRAAFVALMRELKKDDPQHTVLMVQVENEAGSWGSPRDFSAEANKLFAGQVPAAVLKAVAKAPGTWAEVFGKDADNNFYAWSIASYIDKVAEAGKAVYPLPMYVNAPLRDPFHGGPGSYESGSATDLVLPVWKAAAPAIDVIGTDHYDSNYSVYTKVLDLYHRPDNATFVPETGNEAVYARYLFAALGHGAIGFSPFGMDATGYFNAPLGAANLDAETFDPFMTIYSVFAPMQRVIAKLNFEGKVQAVAEDPANHVQMMDFGKWRVKVSYGLTQFGGGEAKGNKTPEGGALVAELGTDEFLVTALHARVEFDPTEAGKQKQFLRVEEGYYENGVWHFVRIWNGDQTDYGLNFTGMAQVLKVRLATY